MNARISSRAALSCLVLVGACGDSGTGPDSNGLIGDWHATKFEVVTTASPSATFELVALGGSMSAEENADQTYRLTTRVPGNPDEVVTGTWSSTSHVLTIQYNGQSSVSLQFDWTLSGNILTLSGAAGVFDFDGDGFDDDATLNMVLVRQ